MHARIGTRAAASRQPRPRKFAVRRARHGWCMSVRPTSAAHRERAQAGGRAGAGRVRGLRLRDDRDDAGRDEIVSLAVVRLDADGVETGRFARLVRPSRPIPAEATAVHGIARRGRRLRAALRRDRAASCSSCSTAPCSSRTTPPSTWRCSSTRSRAPGSTTAPPEWRARSTRSGCSSRSPQTIACESLCERRGIVLEDAHDALSDALATAALLRVLLDEGIAPETVELDHAAFLRLRSRGDTRPATERQIRRVFGLARSAGLAPSSGGVDRDQVVALVQRVAGTDRRRLADARAGAGRLRRPRPADRGAAGVAPGRCSATSTRSGRGSGSSSRSSWSRSSSPGLSAWSEWRRQPPGRRRRRQPELECRSRRHRVQGAD